MSDPVTVRPIEEVAAAVASWESAGERVEVHGHHIWCARFGAAGPVPQGNPPLLILHGFPSCSFDWSAALPALRQQRDVVVLDFVGFGLSDKPDQRYSLRNYADGVEAVAAHFGLTEVDLLTHDMGDSVGGEILARSLEGTLGFTIRRRVLTNGSIYIDMAQLTIGQQLLLGLPDAQEAAVGADGGVAFRAGLIGTFAPDTVLDARTELELDAVVAMSVRSDGLSMLPRTIRYIEDRRAEERRFTGAIETHPSPIGVVWGDLDPVAVHDMAVKLTTEARPGTPLVTLDGVGHYPMVEAPDRLAAAVLDLLDRQLT